MNKKIIVVFVIFAIILTIAITLLVFIKKQMNNQVDNIDDIANELEISPSHKINNGLQIGEYFGESLIDTASTNSLKLIINSNETYILEKKDEYNRYSKIQTGIYSFSDDHITFQSNNDIIGIDGVYEFKISNNSSGTAYYINNENWSFYQFNFKADVQ